jgi:hypothetical protein
MPHHVSDSTIVLSPDKRRNPDPVVLARVHHWLGNPLAYALLTQYGPWPAPLQGRR